MADLQLCVTLHRTTVLGWSPFTANEHLALANFEGDVSQETQEACDAMIQHSHPERSLVKMPAFDNKVYTIHRQFGDDACTAINDLLTMMQPEESIVLRIPGHPTVRPADGVFSRAAVELKHVAAFEGYLAGRQPTPHNVFTWLSDYFVDGQTIRAMLQPRTWSTPQGFDLVSELADCLLTSKVYSSRAALWV